MTSNNFLTILSVLADKIEMMEYINKVLDDENNRLNCESRKDED